MVCIRTSGVLHTIDTFISETLNLHGTQSHDESVLGCQVTNTQQSIIAAIILLRQAHVVNVQTSLHSVNDMHDLSQVLT